MTEKYYEAINWNDMEDRVDKSAWARLNDIIWEPRNVPVREDKKEFIKLDKPIQEALLHAFGALSFSSGLQMRNGIEQIKADAITPEESAVLNALQYLESIANKGYSYVLHELSDDKTVEETLNWANNNPYLQNKIHILNKIYQSGDALQKKAADVILETALYHSGFFAPLYLFGDGKMVRTAEIVKLALRGTSFSGIYPGYKFRLGYSKLGKNEQDRLKEWIDNLYDELVANEEKHIHLMYKGTGWEEDVKHYFYYSVNKAYLNLGFSGKYPDTADTINATIEKGVIKSAVLEDFFFYTNDHSLNKFKEIK
ncbi:MULTISPECIES: ribonucleotide-diphosphate reductase subunit beta [unclassified Lactobacillus]|uniref:ribonucleotide-diphosphate reductase subunit beta n=1 Tax=unclassified Lactobacillus TaxID=2620435 RepID=UPI000BEED96C|nr:MULTISPECIES: ribonucleotide-diphosphate reductase subunit beta [unclassified Lactobacillus]PEG86186.1 ribonucleotide-diphosphate reductase subunit beta [Lactobacillus sp. UMNPBX14]PEH01727.1 ribonucleotide-diphosphate reductase subunit beta [Lactobacillus sp. UMNPBX6]